MSACTNRIANPYDCTEEEAREIARNFDPNNQLDEIIFSASADALKDMVREYMGC